MCSQVLSGTFRYLNIYWSDHKLDANSKQSHELVLKEGKQNYFFTVYHLLVLFGPLIMYSIVHSSWELSGATEVQEGSFLHIARKPEQVAS